MIRTARIERKLTAEELAERAGVSRGLVYRADEGDMGSATGAVVELATIFGVPLFTPEQASMALHTANAEKTLSLMPCSVYLFKKVINDDF